MGKSLGTAPTLHIASIRKPIAAITISPFSSIKQVIKDKVGFLSYLTTNSYFDNIAKAAKVSGSTNILIIHGKLDTLINFYHSFNLHKTF